MLEEKGNGTNEDIIVPKHIAIIMDGNGRWAKKKKLPRIAGHIYGIEVIKKIIGICKKKKIKILTLFAFSSENWNRPLIEVSNLMYLFLLTMKTEICKLDREKTCIKIIGNTQSLSPEIQREMQFIRKLTKDHKEFFLNIAINYGGRWDIVQACKKISLDIVKKKLSLNDIDEKVFNINTSLSQFPEPDLFIRTGGEQRNSNFLLWQLAYTEYLFTNTLWPDFTEKNLNEAILEFQKRQRNFGHIE